MIDSEQPRDALIGFTGFVGSALDRQRQFHSRFNSSNIETIAGGHFDTVICAGTSAEKWKANINPAADVAGVMRLWELLRTVHAKSVVLISTVDVYPAPRDVDELSAIAIDECHAYGRHRLELERLVANNFDAAIIRLPGLFGHGLKKNALHDLLHNHETDRIDSRGAFQFFDVTSLSALIDNIRGHGLSLLNVTSEPVRIADVAEHCFGLRFQNHLSAPPARYDVKSIHADTFGGNDGYLADSSAVLSQIKRWVESERMTPA